MGRHPQVVVVPLQAQLLARDSVCQLQSIAAAIGQAYVRKGKQTLAGLGGKVEVADGEFIVAQVLEESQARIRVFLPAAGNVRAVVESSFPERTCYSASRSVVS